MSFGLQLAKRLLFHGVSLLWHNKVRRDREKLLDVGDVPGGVNGTAGLMLNQALMEEPRVAF